MEFIQVGDVEEQIVTLKKLVRISDPGVNPLLTANSIRAVDFDISKDFEWVNPNPTVGLSFATSMKQFKKLVKSKGRFFNEIDVYAIDDNEFFEEGLRFIRDSPGHASLTVTRKMKVGELISKLEKLSKMMESIGKIKVNP